MFSKKPKSSLLPNKLGLAIRKQSTEHPLRDTIDMSNIREVTSPLLHNISSSMFDLVPPMSIYEDSKYRTRIFR